MNASRWFLAILFIGAGLNHFRAPQIYEPLMPPFLPFPRELILMSGALEILGGVLILPAKTRRWGMALLLFLLAAVFPANIWAALNGLEWEGSEVPGWILWARLPLQIPLAWWVWRVGKS